MNDLNIKDALKNLGGSVSLYRTLVQGFRDKYSQIDIEIKENLYNHDIKQARRQAHSLKGLCGNLGATELQRISKDLEEIIKLLVEENIKDEDIDRILENEWNLFAKELGNVKYHISKVIEANDEEILIVDASSELKGIQDRMKHGSLDFGINMSCHTKSFLMYEASETFQTLVRALNTYNYELVKAAVGLQNEDLLNNCCYEKWEKIKKFIDEYEFDEAKELILEGVLDEI